MGGFQPIPGVVATLEITVINMSVWDEIKNKLSIEDVISDYVPIKPKGVNFTCNCPFHNEKTPSLIISPEKQIWHCFGCGAGGNIFGFVELIENLTKKEVLQKLAAKASVELKPLQKKLKQKTWDPSQAPEQEPNLEEYEVQYSQSTITQGFELLDWSANLYHKLLLQALQDPNNHVSQYCFKRGLTKEIITKFRLGLAPNDPIISQLLIGRTNQLELAKDLSLTKD